MSDDGIHQRGKAIEDQFFREKDRQLLEKLRSEVSAAEQRQALASVSGVSDNKVLDTLQSHGIQAETLVCLSLIPLISIAWADGRLELAEREAVLAAAAESGVTRGSASYELLSSWLQTQPGPQLLATWKSYVQAIREKLDSTARMQMKNTILNRAQQVAQSAGGLFGIGKVSSNERQLLTELESLF